MTDLTTVPVRLRVGDRVVDPAFLPTAAIGVVTALWGGLVRVEWQTDYLCEWLPAGDLTRVG